MYRSMRTCPRCNNGIYRSKMEYNTAHFCRHCGKNLTQPDTPTSYEPPTYDTETTYQQDLGLDPAPLDTYDTALN